MATTYTSKFRLAKTQPGTLNWWLDFYNSMEIIDKHVPRIFMSAPRVVLLTLQAGGSLTAGRYYYYKVVAFQDAGCTIETLASWELTSALADVSNKTILVNWSAVTGAAKYKVYRYDTTDAGYVPLDSDFLYLATVSAPTASYTDTGAVAPAGAMPTTLNWYVTEVDPTYVIPVSETSPSALVGSPADLSDNLTNIRRMIKLLNGETVWNVSPYTNFAQLRDGKSGGLTIVGGTANTEHLDLKANYIGGGVGQIRMNSPVNMLDNILYGSATANQDLILQASSHATNNGRILLNNILNMQGNALYGDKVASGILTLDSTSHATKGTINIGSVGSTVNITGNIGITNTTQMTGRLGINVAPGVYDLNVNGNVNFGGNIGITNTTQMTGRLGINVAPGVYDLNVNGNVNFGGTIYVATNPGTANQVLGKNAAATNMEYKTITGAGNQITITHGANQMTIGVTSPLYITTLGGSGANRVTTAYITTLYLGDLILDNGWRLDDKTEELFWISPKGKKYRMRLEELN